MLFEIIKSWQHNNSSQTLEIETTNTSKTYLVGHGCFYQIRKWCLSRRQQYYDSSQLQYALLPHSYNKSKRDKLYLSNLKVLGYITFHPNLQQPVGQTSFE